MDFHRCQVDIYTKGKFMGTYKNKAYPLRIDEKLMKKLDIIAKKNNRTKNKEIEYALMKYIDVYENTHGEIKIEEK